MGIQAFGGGGGPPDLHLPIGGIVGDVFDVAVAGEQLGRGLSTPFGDSWNAVGRVAGQRQQVWYGAWRNAEFLDHAGLAHNCFPAPVKADHGIALDHLGQVLVRGADNHLFNFAEPGAVRGGSCEGVVGLVFNHWPDQHPQSLHRPFSQFELGQQVFRSAFAGLVAIEHIVPERPHNMVERAGNVGYLVFPQQIQKALHDAPDRAHRTPVRRLDGWKCEIGPEQFIGAVHQVDLHRTLFT